MSRDYQRYYGGAPTTGSTAAGSSSGGGGCGGDEGSADGRRDQQQALRWRGTKMPPLFPQDQHVSSSSVSIPDNVVPSATSKKKNHVVFRFIVLCVCVFL